MSLLVIQIPFIIQIQKKKQEREQKKLQAEEEERRRILEETLLNQIMRAIDYDINLENADDSVIVLSCCDVRAFCRKSS